VENGRLSDPGPISRTQWAAFSALAVVSIALAFFAGRSHPEIFAPFFGAFPPVAAIALAALTGAAALWSLDRARTAIPLLAARGQHFLVAALFAVPFALVAIGIDLTLGFPSDINVPLPGALAFYPAMAVFVECALHAAPFALILLAGQRLFGRLRGAIVAAIVLPSLIEPVLQAGYAGGTNAGLLASLVALHVFAISVAQLTLFWRYGFWAMLTFRLAYYALWHIAWGAARLDLLF